MDGKLIMSTFRKSSIFSDDLDDLFQGHLLLIFHNMWNNSLNIEDISKYCIVNKQEVGYDKLKSHVKFDLWPLDQDQMKVTKDQIYTKSNYKNVTP